MGTKTQFACCILSTVSGALLVWYSKELLGKYVGVDNKCVGRVPNSPHVILNSMTSSIQSCLLGPFVYYFVIR